ncbi:DUF2974 domain-containing protein [Sphingomonas sp. AP4-R1]|uniref:DUF2974 domain-containing protein n=1 Tax=Sphingomonas sp. AP4-R1 TaxID=2735134 RepID=UPI00149335B1|nr:DUF2974 domain-containing protein [Sphingomonas sp. AP4-R1]QJU59909.1 DUF2974 domain-containing protein [Sphingomonas sp. AP4-R1]
MIQSVSTVAAAPASRPSDGASGSGASAYAADWQGTPSVARAPAPSAPAAPANDTDLTARTQESALLAADVYNDVPKPPAGYRVAGESELAELGLTPTMLEQPGVSSFRARVYATADGEGGTRYIVSFRGSKTGEDWQNNLQQGLGMDAPSYAKALQIGRQLARSGAEVTLTGHSLGGGLASAAAIASGREADTFNAAGLSDRTIGEARGIAAAQGRGAAAVQAWHVPGEALTLVQDGGDRVAGSILGGLLGGPIGGIAGGVGADAPEAYGSRHTLPDVRPEGKSFWDGLNPVDRHGIDWVLAGAAALR